MFLWQNNKLKLKQFWDSNKVLENFLTFVSKLNYTSKLKTTVLKMPTLANPEHWKNYNVIADKNNINITRKYQTLFYNRP